MLYVWRPWKKGPIKLRSSDAFTIDLREEGAEVAMRFWKHLPRAANPLDPPPPPSIDHVAVSKHVGESLSLKDVHRIGLCSTCKLVDPASKNPAWRMLNVRGQQPSCAWGCSCSLLGATKAVKLGGHAGEARVSKEFMH